MVCVPLSDGNGLAEKKARFVQGPPPMTHPREVVQGPNGRGDVTKGPLEPKGSPQINILPDDISAIDSGLTFEQKGLRARVVLERTPSN